MTGENYFDQNKRSELRLLIPSESAETVIGSGGAFIKNIRTKFDAIVTIPNKSKAIPERVLTIICSQKTIIDCFTEIFKKLEEDQLGEPEVFMLLHQSHAAAVIGAGGANITKLREQTNSHLQVFNECCPNSDDRLFMISCAQQEQLIEIVKKTIAFLKKKTIPSKLIGTIVGKDGQLINRGKSRAKIEIDTTTHGADERIICITGTPSEIEVAKHLIDESLRKSKAGRLYLKQLQLKNVSISSKSKRS